MRCKRSGDLMHNLVTKVDSTVLCNWNLLRAGLTCPHTDRKGEIWEVMDELINYLNRIPAPCTYISNHSVHSKYLIIFYVTYISIKVKNPTKTKKKPTGLYWIELFLILAQALDRVKVIYSWIFLIKIEIGLTVEWDICFMSLPMKW